MSLLAELDDHKLYIQDPEAEVLDEHTQYRIGDDGKETEEVLRVFDRAYLEKLAANNNRRDAEGAPCAMTIGHTLDDRPETEQPPVVGYWRKFRVAWSAARKRHVLLAVPYLMAKHAADARTFPRASVEHWRRAEILDPIAVLRRTPERAVQWTAKYGMRGWRPLAERGYMEMAPEPRDRYAMELGGDPTGAKPGADPAGPPSAAEPGPEELDRFAECAAKTFPHLRGYHDKFMAGAMAAAAPGAAMPETPEKFAALEAEHRAAKDKMSAYEAEIKTLRESHAALERQVRMQNRRADLDRLAMKRDFDVAEELKDAADLPADQYAAHLKRIETRYQKKKGDPTAGAMLDVDGKAAAPEVTRATVEKAEQHMREQHDRYERLKLSAAERWKRSEKFALTGKEE